MKCQLSKLCFHRLVLIGQYDTTKSRVKSNLKAVWILMHFNWSGIGVNVFPTNRDTWKTNTNDFPFAFYAGFHLSRSLTLNSYFSRIRNLFILRSNLSSIQKYLSTIIRIFTGLVIKINTYNNYLITQYSNLHDVKTIEIII